MSRAFDIAQFHVDFAAMAPEVTLGCGAMLLLQIGRAHV